MSLYNMLHGCEPTAPFVLGALDRTPGDFPRFRDAYFTYRDGPDSDPIMVVLTRSGGANRSDFEAENAAMRALPGYIDDADDEFDVTFALFRYTVPEDMIPVAAQYLQNHGMPLTLREKTEQAIGPHQTVRQKTAGGEIAAQIKDLITKGGA